MNAAISLVIFSIAAPAAVALAAALVLERILPERIGQRMALAVALAAGFCAGYWLLGEWTTLIPQRHRQWLPWLAIAAAFVGGIRASSYVSWIAWTLLAAASAWVLVPTWATLWPPRLVTIPLLAAYLLLLMALLAALPDRLLGRLFVVLLTAAAIGVALLIAIGVSLKISQVALAGAAAFGGCSVAAFTPSAAAKSVGSAQAAASRGLIPAFAVLIGGLAFAGTIEPQPPLPIVLLAPAAPLMLWLFVAGPLAKMQGWKAAALQVAVVLVPLTVALAVIAIAA
jgi:hypothetical protein